MLLWTAMNEHEKKALTVLQEEEKLWGRPVKLLSNDNKSWEDFLFIFNFPCYRFYKDVFMLCNISNLCPYSVACSC